MIHVEPHPEPEDFYERVKKKGEEYLRQISHPTEKQFSGGHSYWRNVIPDLRRCHNGICAYCGIWISLGTGTPTIDHYLSKKEYPELAYDWYNYRLCCLILNSRKGCHTDVLDPFEIQTGWFELDFNTFMILPHPNLPVALKQKIKATIKRLRLNEDEAFIECRYEWFNGYISRNYPLAHLEERAPFIAAEVIRQGLSWPEV